MRSLLQFLLLTSGCAERVAIVGAGVGGSAAARWLADDGHEVTVFERDDRVGGRARTVQFQGAVVDTGATAISSQNAYLGALVLEFSLEAKASDASLDTVGIWNGAAFVLEAAQSALVARVLERYGATALAKVLAAVRVAVGRLTPIYEMQQRDVSFESPRAMFDALQLTQLADTSAYDFFEQLGVPEAFVREFVDGVSRDNYNQPGTINAFADLVSLAGAGLDGAVFELANGTQPIAEKLLRASAARVRTSAEVLRVRDCDADDGGGGFSVLFRGADNRVLEERFDAVLLATPLEFTRIELPEAAAVAAGSRRPYEPNFVAFVAGTLDAAVFGAAAPALDAVLTVEDDQLDFSCIGAHGRRADGTPLYKLMSRRRLTDGQLDALFVQGRSDALRVDWNASGAYTVLDPTESWPPFQLAPGLFYLNAMESPVSCMETQIIAAKNAQLLTERFLQSTRRR